MTPLDHQAAGLALEMTRISGAILVAPMPTQNAPARVKAAIALMLAFVAHGVTAASPPLFDRWIRVVLAAPAELLLGVAMGMTLRIAISSVEIAADTVGPMMGFGTGSLFDPRMQSSESPLGRLMRLFAMLLAMVVGVHRLVIGALVASFRVVPVGAVSSPEATALDLVDMTGEAIGFGLRLALPVVAVLLVGQAALAFVSRASPQMQIFSVGFAVMAVLGTFAWLASLTDFSEAVVGELGRVGMWLEVIIDAARG